MGDYVSVLPFAVLLREVKSDCDSARVGVGVCVGDLGEAG